MPQAVQREHQEQDLGNYTEQPQSLYLARAVLHVVVMVVMVVVVVVVMVVIGGGGGGDW